MAPKMLGQNKNTTAKDLYQVLTKIGSVGQCFHPYLTERLKAYFLNVNFDEFRQW